MAGKSISNSQNISRRWGGGQPTQSCARHGPKTHRCSR